MFRELSKSFTIGLPPPLYLESYVKKFQCIKFVKNLQKKLGLVRTVTPPSYFSCKHGQKAEFGQTSLQQKLELEMTPNPIFGHFPKIRGI